jgi:prepilin-type processing-associated H-X9-DG protein
MLNVSDYGNSAFKGPFSVVRQFGARFADITDGTSNVALASEIVAIESGGDDRGAWGWCTGPLFSGGNNNCSGPSGAASGFAILTPNCKTRYDCSHYSANDSSNANVNLRSNPDAAGEAGVGARGFHPGGVQMALCDGSVRFVSATVDGITYVNFLSIGDGNATQLD